LKTQADKAGTLMELLIEKYPESPRTRIKKLLRSGAVRVNDLQVTLNSYWLKPGDIVDINTHSVKDTAAFLPFPVLYEDHHVIVIDKPAGYPTSSTDGSKSIQMMISEVLREKSKGKIRAFVVHRLDKEVSGVLLFAKTEESMEIIKERWKETEKHYYALVEGSPEREEGTVESWLTEDKAQKVHSTVRTTNAKFSITHYRKIKSAGSNTLLDVRTETGRKNQIRVHMSDLGCPIVGDRKYGASDEFKRRVRLHAYSLSFPHPITGQILTVKSELPKGFLTLKAGNERYK
jgi:23S rRNA pseudouridine1911/1915/1917 synthase